MQGEALGGERFREKSPTLRLIAFEARPGPARPGPVCAQFQSIFWETMQSKRCWRSPDLRSARTPSHMAARPGA